VRCEHSTNWLHSGRAARASSILYTLRSRQPHTSWDLSSAVSDSQADCRNTKDKADILAELEKGVGFDKCNALVVGLLREALIAQGRAALVRLPAAERAGSLLFINLTRLLREMGKPEEARLLFEEQLQVSKEAMRANRETLGDRHEDTLNSIYDTGYLLRKLGKLEEARPLVEEALKGQRETLGDRDTYTLSSIQLLGYVLKEMGRLEEARPLYEEELQACRERDGDRDPNTLTSIGILADLLKEQGKLVEAIPLFTEELEGWVLLYGVEHPETRDAAEHLVSTLREAGQQEEAEALAEKHGLAGI
jgi:tetratricopeptide (TPR) repeat protein